MNDNIKRLEHDIEFADCTNKCKQPECGLAPCCRENIAVYLDFLGYCIARPEAEIKAEAVKEFAEKVKALLDIPFDGDKSQKQVRKGMEEGLKMALEIAAEFGGERK